jgi:hypothetical protein
MMKYSSYTAGFKLKVIEYAENCEGLMPCLVAILRALKCNISCETPTPLLRKSLTYSSISSSSSGKFPLLGPRNTFLDLLVLCRRALSASSSCGSSGSTVSDYGLEDWAIEVRSPTGEEDFSSSPSVQTGSEAHPASYPMSTRGKARPGHYADHSPPSSGRG